jgi:hypothetical protein
MPEAFLNFSFTVRVLNHPVGEECSKMVQEVGSGQLRRSVYNGSFWRTILHIQTFATK